ncbi:MAG: TIR domain-containing protein [Anaerolineae bacterium]|nr:TIR domain-containing protein [Anaerolineae bacterium]NUQ04292.1 TIR domain-containing protein [Anaerolineae bacterium]
MRLSPQIFISYSRRDSLFAEQIVRFLREAGLVVWWDQDITAGRSWQDAIQEELDFSKAMIVIVSPDSMASTYVRSEYGGFLASGKTVIPVMVSDTPQMPPELRARQWIDMRGGVTDQGIERLQAALQAALFPRYVSETPYPDQRPPADQEAAEAVSEIDREEAVEDAEAVPLGEGAPGAGLPMPEPTPLLTPEPQQNAAAAEARKLEIVTRALSDKPTENDLLGFDEYARAIAGFILHERTEKPLTIAINAPWGSGKSSLMHMIRAELRRRAQGATPGNGDSANDRRSPLASVWFNAWKYDEEETLWAALALEAIRQVADQYDLLDRLWFKLRLNGFDWRRLLIDLLRALLSMAAVAALALLVLLLVGILAGTPPETLLRDIVGPVVFGGGVVALYQFGRSIVQGSRDLLNLRIERYTRQQPDYQAKIGFLAEFEQDFSRLVRVVTQNGKYPLVIFIDDLDRCAVPKAADLMEAINIILNMDHCVFIIGMDVRTVAASIEVRYEKLRPYLAANGGSASLLGQQFLEKIIQIVFPIPQPTRHSMERFVAGNLEQQDAAGAAARPAQQVVDAVKGRIAEAPGELTSAKTIEARVSQLDLEALEGLDDDGGALRKAVIEQLILENFDSLGEVKQIVMDMLDFLEYNPRRVKRFINVFRLQAFIAVGRGALNTSNQLKALGACLQIAFRWPEFARRVLDAPQLDNDLHFVATTAPLLGQITDPARRQEVQQQLQKPSADPVVQYFARLPDAEDLVALLPATTPLSDEEAAHIFLLVLQIAASTPIVWTPPTAERGSAAGVLPWT